MEKESIYINLIKRLIHEINTKEKELNIFMDNEENNKFIEFNNIFNKYIIDIKSTIIKNNI